MSQHQETTARHRRPWNHEKSFYDSNWTNQLLSLLARHCHRWSECLFIFFFIFLMCHHTGWEWGSCAAVCRTLQWMDGCVGSQMGGSGGQRGTGASPRLLCEFTVSPPSARTHECTHLIYWLHCSRFWAGRHLSWALSVHGAQTWPVQRHGAVGLRTLVSGPGVESEIWESEWKQLHNDGKSRRRRDMTSWWVKTSRRSVLDFITRFYWTRKWLKLLLITSVIHIKNTFLSLFGPNLKNFFFFNFLLFWRVQFV